MILETVVLVPYQDQESSQAWYEHYTAIRAGLNRSGPWAMSLRLAAHTGLTNQCLKEQGLLSVKELWVKVHYLATAR